MASRATGFVGVPRDRISRHPTLDGEACIGCGACVTGCSRLVYRFDIEARKAVVLDPMSCMVGCTTCANTCPTHALSFPSLDTVMALEALSEGGDRPRSNRARTNP